MRVHRHDAGAEAESLQQASGASVAVRAGRSGTALAAEPTKIRTIPVRRGLRPATQAEASGRGVTSGAAAIYVPGSDSRQKVHWPETLPRRSPKWLPPVAAPERDDAIYYRVCCHLKRHLRDPRKPLIVVIADSPGNELFQRAVAAYGTSSPLRAAADLVLAVTGQPKASGEGESAGQTSLAGKTDASDADRTSLLLSIDRYDLYGNAALLDLREPQLELIELLRIARDRRGVMVVAESDAAVGSPEDRSFAARSFSEPFFGDEWLPSNGWDAADGWTGASAAPEVILELLASDLGVPVVAADLDDLADHCGSILVDPQSWAELSRETQQMAADRRWQLCRLGFSALGHRLLESRRRRVARPSGGRYPMLGTMFPLPAKPIPVTGSQAPESRPAVAEGSDGKTSAVAISEKRPARDTAAAAAG